MGWVSKIITPIHRYLDYLSHCQVPVSSRRTFAIEVAKMTDIDFSSRIEQFEYSR